MNRDDIKQRARAYAEGFFDGKHTEYLAPILETFALREIQNLELENGTIRNGNAMLNEANDSLGSEVARLTRENEELRKQVVGWNILRLQLEQQAEQRGREEGARSAYQFIMSDDISENIPKEDEFMRQWREREGVR